MGKQCDMCFQFKEQLQPVLAKAEARVCKSCGYKVNQVVGFLEYHNMSVSYQPKLIKDPPLPPPDEKLTGRKGKDTP